MAFFQSPPQVPDLYVVDDALHAELSWRLPEAMQSEVALILEALGEHTATTLQRLADAAESTPPQHVPYDAFGRRIDEIRVCDAWEKLKAFSAEFGIVSTGYEETYGEHRRLVQAALIHLFSASSATFSCPLAMTDAAVRVLLDVGPAPLRDRLVKGLISRDPIDFITSGQWMTERAGGSDVGNTETVARFVREEQGIPVFALKGTKWFTSSTTSEIALTLARIEDDDASTTPGSRGLTLFLVEVKRDPHGGLDKIQVNRLKDKLGTKALPTAELTLDGVEAWQLGDRGRGVATIATMLNVTRFYNALASSSAMARATFLAKDYAGRRQAFGKWIQDQPLHAHTLDEMEADTAGGLALCLEIAALMGKQESHVASESERNCLRALIPIAKLTLGKQAVAVTSEALECFGGAGYIEDTGLPRLLRDAQVLAIWEGTTNVLSLDVLRAEYKSRALHELLLVLAERASKLSPELGPDAIAAVQDTIMRVIAHLRVLSSQADLDPLERGARRIAMTTGFVAQALFLGETADRARANQPAAKRRFAAFVRHRLQPAIC